MILSSWRRGYDEVVETFVRETVDMTKFDENNFTFEIETVSYQMIHGKLSAVIDDGNPITVEIQYDNNDEESFDPIYLLAQAYAKLLSKSEK